MGYLRWRDAVVGVKRLRGPAYTRVGHGLYAGEGVDPRLLAVRCAALGLVLPAGAAFSHETAALLQQLPVPDSPLLHLSSPPGGRRLRRAGVRSHVVPLPAEDVIRVDGLPVTRAARTFVDLAAGLGEEELVVFGDAILRRGLARRDELVQRVASSARRHGIAVARSALPLLDGRSDSPGETRTRLTLLAAGLPPPLLNVDVHDEGGHWVARPDLLYEDPPVAIQYDGAHHFASERQRRNDVARDELVRALGYEVVVVLGRDLHHREHLVARVEAARERARGRVPRGSIAARLPR